MSKTAMEEFADAVKSARVGEAIPVNERLKDKILWRRFTVDPYPGFPCPLYLAPPPALDTFTPPQIPAQDVPGPLEKLSG